MAIKPNALRSAKSKPLPVSSPVEDCAKWCDFKLQEKAAKKFFETMKDRMLKLVPENQSAEAFEAERNGMNGEYIVTRIEQERGDFDNERLMQLLKDKKLAKRAIIPGTTKTYTETTLPTPNHEVIAEMVKEGVLSEDEVKACFVPKPVIYPTVVFKEK